MRKVTQIDSSSLIYRYRLYHQEGNYFKTYIARVVGPHPNYYLRRLFEIRSRKSNARFDSFGYFLENGIYEFVVKRFDSETNELISKVRKWLVVAEGRMYEYADEEMNYQYVLYTAFNLRLQEGSAA